MGRVIDINSRRGRSVGEAIEGLTSKIEDQLLAETGKASVSDYLRLLQAQREFDGDRPRDIRVLWIEPRIAS